MTVFEHEDGIVFAYILDGEGGARRVTAAEALAARAAGAFVWLHGEARHPALLRMLRDKKIVPDSATRDALTAEDTRPRAYAASAEGLMLILRGMNFNEGAEHSDMVSLRMWCDGKSVFTMRVRKIMAVLDTEAALLEGRGPKTPGELVCAIAERLIEKMRPVIADIGERLDNCEDLSEAQPTGNAGIRSVLHAVRRDAALFRRYMLPQRDALIAARSANTAWLNDRYIRSFAEQTDTLMRYIEDIEAVRERAQALKEDIAAALSDRMNRNMYVLSVISAVFLPPAFLTGLAGVNLAGMPGAENGSAFGIFLFSLIAMAGAQIWIFRKCKWF